MVIYLTRKTYIDLIGKKKPSASGVKPQTTLKSQPSFFWTESEYNLGNFMQIGDFPNHLYNQKDVKPLLPTLLTIASENQFLASTTISKAQISLHHMK
jgi:hypothetical protein